MSPMDSVTSETLATPQEPGATPSRQPRGHRPRGPHAPSGPAACVRASQLSPASAPQAGTDVRLQNRGSQPSTRAGELRGRQWVDRRLKVISVLLPVTFIVALEFAHYTVEARDRRLDGFWDGYRPPSLASPSCPSSPSAW